MPIALTDYVSINRGGTPGDGSTGTYYVGTVQEVINLVSGQTVVSADAGNIITAGTDTGALVTQADIQANETTTSLAYNAGTNVLTFTDEDGGVTNLDLSALAADIFVNGASITAGGILTLTDNDGGTADVTVDLSAYYNSITDNQAGGSTTFTNAAGNTVIQKTAWMSAAVAP